MSLLIIHYLVTWFHIELTSFLIVWFLFSRLMILQCERALRFPFNLFHYYFISIKTLFGLS